MKKIIVLLIFFVASGLLGWQIYQKVQDARKQPKSKGRNMSVPVEVANVEKKIMRDFGYFSGTLQPKSQFMVAPKISGRLNKLGVNMGDEIQNGQEIALLDDAEYLEQVEEVQAELNVAKANVEENKSNVEIAERELQRLESLGNRELTSKSQLDLACAQYKVASAKNKVAQSQVAQKEAALNAMKIRLSYTKIKVSWPEKDQKRVVGERLVHEGAMLSANSSIVSVLDINSVIAVVYVIERDYTKVRIGQEASLATDTFPGRSFLGKVMRIAPLLKENSRQARVEIQIPNPDWLLKPGMFVNAKILFEEHANVTVVPVTALTRRNDQDGVFAVNPETQKARFVPITFGISEGTWVEVSKPPLEGLVVTLGQHLLSDEANVLIPKAKTKDRPKERKAR
jgi:RND family efflux transporter MFP subunit